MLNMQKTEDHMIDVPGGKVWSQIIYTDTSRGKPPLILLHGGPGGYHDKLKWALTELAADFPLIFYDQLGGGNSALPDDVKATPELWQIPRFVAELAAVIKHYQLTDFHLFGTSWGCTLALEYIFTADPHAHRPISLILSSPLVNTQMWIKDANRLKDQLPPQVRRTLISHEQAGTTDTPEYQTAAEVFNQRHVLKTELLTPEQLKFIAGLGDKYNVQAYTSMWGPTEFFASGSLKTYDRYADLAKISIPTLFLCGEFDEATPETVELFHHQVLHSEFSVFKNCSHQAYFEDKTSYCARLKEFILTKSN